MKWVYYLLLLVSCTLFIRAQYMDDLQYMMWWGFISTWLFVSLEVERIRSKQ